MQEIKQVKMRRWRANFQNIYSLSPEKVLLRVDHINWLYNTKRFTLKTYPQTNIIWTMEVIFLTSGKSLSAKNKEVLHGELLQNLLKICPHMCWGSCLLMLMMFTMFSTSFILEKPPALWEPILMHLETVQEPVIQKSFIF